ncbi:MAG: HEAT repeat domain-containing protein [Deltaproteobacteria bacterium]|nr:HEAT repeat domain-containing protein [Deltaproteobacteria bacterium]
MTEMTEIPIQQLIDQLGAPLADVQQEAQRALASQGQAAIAPLVRALGNPRREVRVGAMLTLGSMGATAALPALQLLADNDPDVSLRPVALRAISDLAHPKAGRDLKIFLIRKLGDDDHFVRALACRALGRIADSDARKALNLALEDSESWVRDAARQALVLARAHGAARQEGDTDNESMALVRAPSAEVAAQLRGLLSLDVKVQRLAIERLGAIGDDAALHVAPLLYHDVKSTRRAAIETLGSMASALSANHLLDLLADDALEDDLRATTLHTLAHSPLTGEALEGAARPDLKHPDRYVRAAATVCALHGGSHGRALALKTIIDDEDEWVHVTGFQALQDVASAEDRQHRRLLVEALARVVDPVAQGHLLLALRRIFVPPQQGDPSFEGSLRYFLDSKHDLVREAALLLSIETTLDSNPMLMARVREALREDPRRGAMVAASLARVAREDDEGSLDVLAKLLRDPEDGPENRTQRDAARGLMRIGTEAALELLIACANECGEGTCPICKVLETQPAEAELRATREEGQSWRLVVQPRCSACQVPLVWTDTKVHEELRCPNCQVEYVLGSGQRPIAVDKAPFGLCLCCKRKRLLVRGGRDQTLVCPETKEVHIRPHDTPHQIHLLCDLPLGACACCAERQPLIKVDEKVLCRRTRREHLPDAHGFSLPAPAVGVTTDIDAINEALLGGTLDIGQSGVPLRPRASADEAPASEGEDDTP